MRRILGLLLFLISIILILYSYTVRINYAILGAKYVYIGLPVLVLSILVFWSDVVQNIVR